MCHWGVNLVLLIIATVKSESESSEDTPSYTFKFSNPSTLNFQDIYTNLVTSAEERSAIDDEPSTTTEETKFVINQHRSQFVEFHQEAETTEEITQPPPKYIINSTYFNSTFLHRPLKSRKGMSTTEDPDDLIKVVPMKKVERGVLDLLFPETRVKTFKNIFNTIKRMLSYTFRR